MNKKKKIDPHEILKHLAREDLMFFVKYCVKNYKMLWFHQEMCSKIQKLIDGTGKKNLMIFIGPQHGKSTLVSEALPAFILGQNKKTKVAIASYSSALACKMNRSVQRLMQEQEYKELFYNIELGKKGFSLNTNEFEIASTGSGLKAVGVNGSLTGFTVDFGIIDDPFKGMLEAYSERQRERVWEWYRSVWKARQNSGTKTLLVQTRWHQDDLAGKILSSSEADEWDVLTIPTIREEIKTVESDPREIGEALWEAFHPAKTILKEKEDSERRFNAIHQQHPSSFEGNIIKRSWVNYYDSEPPYFEKIIQSWDCGFKTTGNSWVVGTVWGVSGTDIYLLAMNRGKYDFVETVKEIKKTIDAFPGSIILIEDKANGSAAMSQLKIQVPGIIPVLPLGSKEERMNAASFIFEAGNVYLPRGEEWVATVEDELFNFPLAKTDDICDTISQVICYNYVKQRGRLFKMGN